jgi:hypothetical protein
MEASIARWVQEEKRVVLGCMIEKIDGSGLPDKAASLLSEQ